MASIEQSLMKSLGITGESDTGNKRFDAKLDVKKDKTTKTTKVPRKYSDNKYDKPEFEARIEQQTLRAVEALIRDQQQQPAVKKEKKNMFGLAFDIPDELQ